MMIIKLLDNNERPLCVYANGRWAGNTTPMILSEAIEILVSGLKNRPERHFQETIKHFEIIQPKEQP